MLLEKKRKRDYIYINIIIFSILIIVISATVILFSSFNKNQTSYESASTAMGTYVQQTVYDENGKVIADEVTLRIKKLEDLISWSNEDSEVFKINENRNKKWTDVSDSLLDVLNVCYDVSSRTDGMFDVTTLPLESLWGFNSGSPRLPSHDEILGVQKSVNFKNLRINNDVKRVKIFDDNAQISLDSISHGLACSTAVNAYKQMGVKAGIIAVGKSVGVYGSKSSGKPWNIALRDPLNLEDRLSFAVVKINDGYVSTVSLNDNFFEQDGVKYHSVLDTRTGYPVENNILSVTVVSSDGAVANILARACFALGRENSEYLLNHYGASAIFVDEDKKVFVSSKIKDSVVLTDKTYQISPYTS